MGIWLLLSKESVWRPELLCLGSTSPTQVTCGREACGGCNCDMRLLVPVTARSTSCLAAALHPFWIPVTSSNFSSPLQRIPGNDFC